MFGLKVGEKSLFSIACFVIWIYNSLPYIYKLGYRLKPK